MDRIQNKLSFSMINDRVVFNPVIGTLTYVVLCTDAAAVIYGLRWYTMMM